MTGGGVSRTLAAAFVLAASVTLLVACAPAPAAPPPPGPTKRQLSDMLAVWAASESTVFAAEVPKLLSEVKVKRLVTDDEWADVMTGCVARMGATGISYGRWHPHEVQVINQSPQQQRRADYANAVCTIEYPPASLRLQLKTPQQLDYIYDYFETRLIPCLRASGHPVTGKPTRGSFVNGAGYGLVMWSPYDGFATQEVSPTDETAMKLLRAKCPEMPEGMVR